MRCSFFRNAFDDSSTHYVAIESILAGIKSGFWEEKISAIRKAPDKKTRDKLKLDLPNAAFSGTFEKKKVYNQKKGKWETKARLDENILDYSGLVVIDIDQTEERVVKGLQDMLPDDPYVYSFFLSPSKGIKILYKVDSNQDKHKNFAFEQIKEWVESHYQVKVDPSGKNLSRICYVSHDPQLFYNPNCEVYPVDLTEKEQEYVNQYDFSGNGIETDLNEVYKTVKTWLHNAGKTYSTGGRNNYLHAATCILNRAGLSAYQIEGVICNNHSISKEMLNELQSIIKGVVTRNSHEFGSKPIYSKKKKRNNQNDLTSLM